MEDLLKELSKAEEIVLLAIWRLGDNAYGVSVRKQIKIDTEKDYSYGTLYGILRQLDFKGLVEKLRADPTPEKGGRGKTYFKLTSEGIGALKAAIEFHRRVWRDIEDWSFNGG